ncbi:MAG: arsenate reductase ArsC [Georgfuchsia sp.]
MTHLIKNVLILCTGNSARSILAEAIFNRDGRDRFHAYSAGSHPAGYVNPYALELLQREGFDISNLRSKSWDEFAVASSPQMDLVLTVCDNAVGEMCPVWPGQPISAHWGIEDPAAVEGRDEDKRRAFFRAFNFLQRRIALFLALPLDKLDRISIKRELEQIGNSRDEVK